MINVVKAQKAAGTHRQITCEFVGCTCVCSFGVKGGKAQYCKAHKFDSMVCCRGSVCKQGGCDTQPSYNTPGAKAPIYCSKDKLDGMVHLQRAKKVARATSLEASEGVKHEVGSPSVLI